MTINHCCNLSNKTFSTIQLKSLAQDITQKRIEPPSIVITDDASVKVTITFLQLLSTGLRGRPSTERIRESVRFAEPINILNWKLERSWACLS